MLRYFIRVALEYGVAQARAALAARQDTGCYHALFHDLGDKLPSVEQLAIAALNDPDPEVARDAAQALSQWGSAKAEGPLWARLKLFHQEWAGREAALRSTPNYEDPISKAVMLEQQLVFAIAGGIRWSVAPGKLERLAELTSTRQQREQVRQWIEQWQQGPAQITPNWFPEDSPTFSLLQYVSLSEEQLLLKLSQLPRGTQLSWQFWQPMQISPPFSMERQDAGYERMCAIAERTGVVLGKVNHP